MVRCTGKKNAGTINCSGKQCDSVSFTGNKRDFVSITCNKSHDDKFYW